MFKKEDAQKIGLIKYFKNNDIFAMEATNDLKDYLVEEFSKAIKANDVRLSLTIAKYYQDVFDYNVSDNIKTSFDNVKEYGADFKEAYKNILIEYDERVLLFDLCPLSEGQFSINELIECFNPEVIKLININFYKDNFNL